MEIRINKIQHNWQRYDTVGDYYREHDGRLKLYISDLNNKNYEFLVTIHELIEMLLVSHRNKSFARIDNFDIQFEKDRKKGKHSDRAEPGNSKKAPYHAEHKFATKIERLLAKELKVNWKKYENRIASVSK
jgi:hypothetical protein